MQVNEEIYKRINIGKTVCFFDLESTGKDPFQDQIMQVSMIKLYPGGEIEKYDQYVKPDFAPAEGAFNKHGITLESLQNEKKFVDVAQDILNFLQDVQVLSGYNIENYDIALLTEEMLRNGFTFNPLAYKALDIFKLLIKMEPRDLESVYKRFTGKSMESAHDAVYDVEATMEIFINQLDKYELNESSVEDIIEKINDGQQKVDVDGKFVVDGEKGQKSINDIMFNFGKYKGRGVEDVYEEAPGYFDWICRNDFSTHTKQVARKLKDKMDTKNHKEQT